MKPLVWHVEAARDADEAALWYASQGGLALADRFLEALEGSLTHLSRHPASGSLRHAMALRLDGMRFWPVRDYPYLVFYVERDTQLDVWRILHAQRDVPAWMGR